ncbi:ribonuclease HII [candidate division KSB1 bacterium]|nr:ribonuclease HII [candidate division KSB1 bacterium]
MTHNISFKSKETDVLSIETELWEQDFTHVAGVDEAGRGPLAGPVVAAAVVFPAGQKYINGINDSKKLSPRQRLTVKAVIEHKALDVGIGIVFHEEIDELNILGATFKAMRLAVESLKKPPDYLLIDGNRDPKINKQTRCLVKGDSLSMSIAAASIIAKVTRDEMMVEYDKLYPLYDFAKHKGYPTYNHIQAIREHGVCPIHRRSFKPKVLLDYYDSLE